MKYGKKENTCKLAKSLSSMFDENKIQSHTKGHSKHPFEIEFELFVDE